MLKWCSWCHRFMHEIDPYDNFRMTHGLCAACEAAHEEPFAKDVVERARLLRETFRTLFDAGRHENVEAATRIVDRAIAASFRPVDILLGMLSPMLFEIGEEWNRGVISVEGEHRFTAFSEKIVQLVEARIDGSKPASSVTSNAPLLFLMNAPGNRHDLAVRILSIWLQYGGAEVRIIEDGVDQDGLMRSIVTERPGYLLISMALTRQSDGVADIARAVQALPHDVRPKTIVGGYPVKVGLIRSIPNAELLSDIGALHFG